MKIKKIKDLTLEECRAICKKARTNKKGKISDYCKRENCPLGGPREYQLTFDNSLKTCEIISVLNKEIEVEEDD